MGVSKQITARGSTGHHTFYLDLYEHTISDEDITNNRSRVDYSFYIVDDANWYWASWGSALTYSLSLNGSVVASGNLPDHMEKTTSITSGTINVPHNSDGTKTMAASFTISDTAGQTYTPGNTSGSGSFVLTNIAREPNITTFTVNKRDDSSVVVNWGTDLTCDYAWYRYKTGSGSYSSYTGVDVTDGTSGSFNISSLAANTTYTFQIKMRGKDSQLSTESSTVNQTTYKTPTQSLNDKSETSIIMNWSADATCDYLWYSKDNGTNWTAVGSINASSGSYTISGLTANTAYNIRTRIRRTATQITDDTTVLAVTTYKIPTFSLGSKTETSFTINWSADSTIDYVWYSTNGGSSYTGLDVTDGTSGSFNVTGLSANTSYSVRMKFRRKSTQTTYEVAAQSFSTYQYPYVSAVGTANLTIGNQQTLTLYNPLGRTVNVYMKQTNTSGTTLYSGTSSSTSATFTPAAATLYSSIPSSSSGNAVYYCVYSNQTVSTQSGTYSIIGNEYPTFAASNWTYACDLAALTNNNQVAVDNYSNINITINTAATSAYGATITKYVIAWGSVTAQTTTTSGTVSAGSGSTLKITAYDSRGLTKETSKTITSIPYTNVAISTLSANGYVNGARGAKLKAKGTFFGNTFGTQGIANTFSYAKYYISTDGTNWSSAYPSGDSLLNSVTLDGNNFSIRDFTIYSDGVSGGFVTGVTYYVKLELKDALGLLSTGVKTSTVVITTKIARDVYRDSNGNYHQGINGSADPDYTDIIHGNECIEDDLTVLDDLTVNGYCYTKTPRIAFGTCSTGASTAAKVVTVSDPAWSLRTGDVIGVRFSNTNTASSVSLNVNSSGAKQIAYDTTRPYTSSNAQICGTADRTIFYQYDGTYWIWMSGGYMPAIYSGTTAPSSSLGNNGDIYIQTT